MNLSPRSRSILIAVCFLAARSFSFSASAAAADEAPSAALDRHTLDKRTAPVLKDLKLANAEQEAKVRPILEDYFTAQAAEGALDALGKCPRDRA